VVAILGVPGRSKMSETPIEMSMAHVVTFRDGKQAWTDLRLEHRPAGLPLLHMRR
jgi:hypothetical protein